MLAQVTRALLQRLQVRRQQARQAALDLERRQQELALANAAAAMARGADERAQRVADEGQVLCHLARRHTGCQLRQRVHRRLQGRLVAVVQPCDEVLQHRLRQRGHVGLAVLDEVAQQLRRHQPALREVAAQVPQQRVHQRRGSGAGWVEHHGTRGLAHRGLQQGIQLCGGHGLVLHTGGSASRCLLLAVVTTGARTGTGTSAGGSTSSRSLHVTADGGLAGQVLHQSQHDGAELRRQRRVGHRRHGSQRLGVEV